MPQQGVRHPRPGDGLALPVMELCGGLFFFNILFLFYEKSPNYKSSLSSSQFRIKLGYFFLIVLSVIEELESGHP